MMKKTFVEKIVMRENREEVNSLDQVVRRGVWRKRSLA